MWLRPSSPDLFHLISAGIFMIPNVREPKLSPNASRKKRKKDSGRQLWSGSHFLFQHNLLQPFVFSSMGLKAFSLSSMWNRGVVMTRGKSWTGHFHHHTIKHDFYSEWD